MINTYKVNKLKFDVQQANKKVAARQGQKDLLDLHLQDAQRRKEQAEADLGVFDLVQILLQKTSDYARQQAKSRIEEIVTSALSVVFEKNYTFRVQLEVRGNRPEASYFLESEGIVTQLKPPDYDRGGGVADVVSLALRLAIAELHGVKGPLFLDEIGKHVSAEYSGNVAYFLKQYSERFGRQLILITHASALAAVGDLSLGVSQVGGVSKVSVI